MHKDRHNHREYKITRTTLCVWGILREASFGFTTLRLPLSRSAFAVRKASDGTKLPGNVHKMRHRVLNFHPKTYHAVRPWKGDRWNIMITSYVSRAFNKLEPSQVAKLKE